MNKPKSKSPPLPQQQTFIKILPGLLIVSLFLMMGSGLQIYNASPVFGGKDGWRMPSWVKLGGGLAMYQPAQLHLLSGLFINWQILRTVHF